MNDYILTCGSTVDLPYSYVSGRDIPVIFYTYIVDGEVHDDDMLRDPGSLDRFYGYLRDGKMPQTSQINSAAYAEFFEEQLKKNDLIHIAFGSGMSNSVSNAIAAGEELKKKYPDRKIAVIDSTCSSSGYGMLVDYAADMRDRGCSFEETVRWIEENKHCIHHQFFSTDLTMYRRSGRMSGATATIATLLSICPIMRLNDAGRIIAYDKVRGKKNAVKTTIETMDKHIRDGINYSGKLWVCHSDCLETAEEFKKALAEHYPNIDGDIRICDIGTIIASHCGPGTLAAFFLGDEREPYDE